MMTDQELGELVVKIQADDVRARDLYAFLNAVINDDELRRNLKLAGKVANLDEATRSKNCEAHILFLLGYSTLAPTSGPRREPSLETTREFANKFQVGAISGWKTHVRRAVQSSTSIDSSKTPNKPNLVISEELHTLVLALEDFWDMRGKFLKS